MQDDDDDYMLTPLADPDDEPSPPMEPDIANEEVSAAEDYVQSLVTIESNWANGKILSVYSVSFFDTSRFPDTMRKFNSFTRMERDRSFAKFQRKYYFACI